MALVAATGIAQRALASGAAVRAARRLTGQPAGGLLADSRASGSDAEPKKTHLACWSDRPSRTVRSGGGEVVATTDQFWNYVADEQSIRDAEKYLNNTENYIGTLKYPVGMIGPLMVKGEHANREYYVPMATHEGALLASYGRGCKAITEAGGCTVRIKHRGMLRAPVFFFENIVQASDFARFVNVPEMRQKVKEHIAEHINHCKVTSLRVIQTDRKVHISIGVDSEAAGGESKATFAGDLVMKAMKEWYPQPIPEMYIEGGFNAGKRVSVIHTLLGKGHSVVVDCVIPKAVCEKLLHTTPFRLQRFQKMHSRTNEYMGGISCTAHVANGLTAFYIANGQDPASVAESQAAVTHFDVVKEPGTPLEDCPLYASMTLNTILVATVGGGTNLPSFKAARDITGVQTSNELAELCAAVCLSGEVSFYAAMESGEFSAAHWNMTHK